MYVLYETLKGIHSRVEVNLSFCHPSSHLAKSRNVRIKRRCGRTSLKRVGATTKRLGDSRCGVVESRFESRVADDDNVRASLSDGTAKNSARSIYAKRGQSNGKQRHKSRHGCSHSSLSSIVGKKVRVGVIVQKSTSLRANTSLSRSIRVRRHSPTILRLSSRLTCRVHCKSFFFTSNSRRRHVAIEI